MNRSPGGTPILDRKRRRESGQGLMPMMNKALRLKFQVCFFCTGDFFYLFKFLLSHSCLLCITAVAACPTSPVSIDFDF